MPVIDDKGILSTLGKTEQTLTTGLQGVDKMQQVERIVKMVVEGLKIVAPRFQQPQGQPQGVTPINNAPFNQNTAQKT
jgi:hypothetical protein